MVAALGRVFSTSSYENPAIVCLDRTEPYRNVEVNVQQLTRLLIRINVVKRYHSLIEFKEVNPVLSLLLSLRISWHESFHAIHVVDRALHKGLWLLLCKKIIDRAPCMRGWTGPAELNIRLQAVCTLSESKVTAGFLGVLVSVIKADIHLTVRCILVLVTHRVEVVRCLVALRVLNAHL